MTKPKFCGVADTLYIPLVARIVISRQFPNYFHDTKALSLESRIPSNLIAELSSEYAMMASVSRCLVMDRVVLDFLAQHQRANIVCIGCGFETMAWRLEADAMHAHFYELDFPSVIESRMDILGVHENETLIPGDVNDLSWTAQMDTTLPTMLVAAGVFQYFQAHEVVALIGALQQRFSNAQLLFDATDSAGLKYAQRYVKKRATPVQ